MNVRDIVEAIEEFAPRELAYEWDRCGLAVGDPEWEVSRVMLALTVTPACAEAARRRRVHLIVSHHPPIWEPLKALRMDDPHTRMCLELAGARIACFAAHTNLDVAPGGVNDTLAHALGLVGCRRLFVEQGKQVKLVTFVPAAHLASVREAICESGAGVIGNYSYCSFSAPGTGTFRPNEFANPAVYAVEALLAGFILYKILSARRGRDLFIRRIPGLSVLDEAVGRATEMGRPMLYAPGLSGLDIVGLQSMAILSHV
ncbi:MAG TPA: Nif3-like dinuclear metal center hexameric protein, partial [Candidatus Hydrogenedentes bacterium]|nr:Nif3-like dinuclear metal center hexameric protein [Candidatus Hydrogenedentota bacterium]